MTAVEVDQLECALLSVLLDAESTREGAAALLTALTPALDDLSAALAVRDRDGHTLHVLAEQGEPTAWPARLDPRAAQSAEPSVDASGTMVAPLRSKGRVVGALLLGDASHAAALLREPHMERALQTTAAVLDALLSRTELELIRRGGTLRSVEQIIEGMAHQMANPLTGASAIAQILADEVDEPQRESIAQIRHELDRAFTVLRDILEFQRDTRAHDGVLDLNAVAERVLRFRGYAIREMGIAVELETAPTFVPVRADNRSLEHALLVALRFAERHSHGTVNRRIHVRVLDRESEGVLEITDSGPGNVPELGSAWFDIRYRGDDASACEPDLGLVDSILRGAGGRLDVRGSKTDGTTMSLVLPRATAGKAS